MFRETTEEVEGGVGADSWTQVEELPKKDWCLLKQQNQEKEGFSV